jgi:hypothetical protein
MRGPNLLCETTSVCNDAWGMPFWAILLVIVLFALLVAALLPAPKEPPPLKKAVDDVLAGYQKQAQVWGDREAETAFINAREDVGKAIDKYKPAIPNPPAP